MRIYTAELRKVLTLRFFLILIVAIVMNLLLLRSSIRRNYVLYDLDAYLAAQQDVLELEDSQRQVTLEKHIQMLDACQNWELYDKFILNGGTGTIDAAMQQYQAVYESGKYLKYTNNVYSESTLIKSLLNDVQQVSNYQQTLEASIQEAQGKTSVAIFSQPGTFSYRNQIALIERLEQLAEITLTYDVSEGILQAQGSATTNLLALLLLFSLCTQMIVTEYKDGVLPILKTTHKGRFPLIFVKIFTTITFAFVITCILWGSNFVYCSEIFGLGDLTRPVQSLSSYTACTLELSVGQYLIFFFLTKWLLYSIVGLLCLSFGLIWHNAMPTWLTISAFLGLEYILSQTITSISAWNIFKYINLSNLIFETDWFREYRNLNVFDYPVEVFTVSCILIGSLLVLGIFFVCRMFCRIESNILLQTKLNFSQIRKNLRLGRTVALQRHENWKLLVECGALSVLVLFLLINLQEPKTQSNTIEELYYKNYMEILSGPLTQEKEIYLENEILRFDNLRIQILQLQQDCTEGKISSSDLETLVTPISRSLEAEDILKERVLLQRDRILALQENGTDSWFVYEAAYDYLFGLNLHTKAGIAASIVAAVILCFANYNPLEITSGMKALLCVYPYGRRKTAVIKIGICLLYATLIYIMAQIPDYWYVISNWGLPSLNAPLCSLEAFTVWGDAIPIWAGIVIFELLRLFTVLSITMVILLLSHWLGNHVATLSVTAGVFLLPVLLHLLDITVLDCISLYLPLTGSELLCNRNDLVKSCLYYALVFAVGIICALLNLKYANNGYQKKCIYIRKSNK